MGNSCPNLLIKAWLQPELYINNKNKQQQQQEIQQQQVEEDEDLEQNISSITEKDPTESVTMDEIVENTKSSLSNRLMNKLTGNNKNNNKKAAEITAAKNQRENIVKAKNAYNKQIKTWQSKSKEYKNEIENFKQNILQTTIKSERLIFADKIKRKQNRIKELEKKILETESKKAILEDFEEQMLDIHDELDSEIHLENIEIDPDKIFEIVSRIQEESGMDKVRDGLNEAKAINSPYSYDVALDRLEEDEDIKNILADIDGEEEAKAIRSAPTPPVTTIIPIRNNNNNNTTNRFVLPSAPPPPPPSVASSSSSPSKYSTSGQQKPLQTKSKNIPNISELDD